jgi:hypothetical protein
METAAEFRKHAANCYRMAKVLKDTETKAVWRRMGERWLLCAKLTEEEEQSATWLRVQRVSWKRHGTLDPSEGH